MIPPSWTVQDTLKINDWVYYEPEKDVMRSCKTPTNIIINNKNYNIANGGLIFIGQGKSILECVTRSPHHYVGDSEPETAEPT